ncbi:hypothetical protein LZ683_08660 [Comamonas testosteroni]|uniref:hypothetical protein n=1 Tax=Comamonas testosteroni TaxID=285 RepID=UPI0023AB16FE|nr:hypothetical protein [Comamonas testosteroni]WEE79412.1 hypothetical protein LZ683_08660 [Comamonas testosteroni]
MRESQKQRLDRCIKFLRPIAQPAEDAAGEVHWLGARNADPDQGPSYCYECCSAEVHRLNEQHPDHEYLVDGGWGYTSDGVELCDKCNKTLRVNLSDYGVASEIDNYLSLPRIKLDSHSAYDILNILECAYMGNADDAPWLRGYELERVKGIQKSVHQLTHRIDRTRLRAIAKAGAQSA